MTALHAPFEVAGHPTPAAFHKRQERSPDPQLTMHHWNHSCPRCTTWVPNHRTHCTTHEEASG